MNTTVQMEYFRDACCKERVEAGVGMENDALEKDLKVRRPVLTHFALSDDFPQLPDHLQSVLRRHDHLGSW